MSELRDIAARLVDIAGREGADDAIAEATDSKTHLVRFSNSEIDAVNSWTESHVQMFIAVGRRMLASDLRDMDGLDSLVRELVSNAKRAPEYKGYGGIASGRFKYKPGRADRAIVNIKDPSKHVHDSISAAESEGAENVGGTLYIRHMRTGVASSGGALATDESASAELSVRAFSQPEASGQIVSCTPKLSSLDAEGAGGRAGELSVKAKDPVLGEQGKFDIIVEPLFLGSVMHSTTRMMSAMHVDIGMSMYANKIGRKVASEEVTIIDDPTIPSTSQRAFDHEGMPTRTNVIVKNGVLKTYLHGTSSAKKFKTKTTANAGMFIPTLFTIPTEPMAFHPVVERGDWKVDELISDTKRGLYLNNTWYTRFQDYSTGEFSTIPRDAILRIEDGEIVGAVKNIRVSDNMLNLWKSVDAVSKSTEEVFWWDEASPPSTLPTLRMRQLNITRSS